MIVSNLIDLKEQQPLLNYINHLTKQPFVQEFYKIHRKKRMKYLIERSPEASFVVDGHARDICGSFHFEPVKDNVSGKILIRRAENFCLKSEYKKHRFAAIKDAICTGEGFLFISELSKEYGNKLATEFRKIDPSFDDVSFRARGVSSVASTTMAVEHNNYDVTAYVQSLYAMAGGKESTRKFSKDQIMHVTFDVPAGSVEGWTPLYTVPLHLELLWLMWDNQYDFQVRGNHPDLVVMAEMLDRNKNAFQKVSKDLQSYNQPGNSKHGTLLLSGDKFNIQQLERMDALQFKESGMFIQSLLASLFHYPQNRLSIKTEQSAKSKDSSGGNEKFYYSTVEQKQDILTDLENRLFWIPYFGVKLVQNKSYKHDEIEENTAQQLRLGNANTFVQMLNAQGKVLKNQKLLDLFNGVDVMLTDSDVEDGELKSVASSTMNNRLSNSDAMNSGMSSNDRAEKRNDELVRERFDGKPNGASR